MKLSNVYSFSLFLSFSLSFSLSLFLDTRTHTQMKMSNVYYSWLQKQFIFPPEIAGTHATPKMLDTFKLSWLVLVKRMHDILLKTMLLIYVFKNYKKCVISFTLHSDFMLKCIILQ
jgi:hypothetical protein